MKNNNFMELTFQSISKNEGFARTCVASFCLQLNPSLEEIGDIKTAVSEAVTNCVVHAYPNRSDGLINIKCEIEGYNLIIKVTDFGIGIKDIEKAMEPFYTTSTTGDRSGMGFAVMESFMDKIDVKNNESGGLTVFMYKNIMNDEGKVNNA